MKLNEHEGTSQYFVPSSPPVTYAAALTCRISNALGPRPLSLSPARAIRSHSLAARGLLERHVFLVRSTRTAPTGCCKTATADLSHGWHQLGRGVYEWGAEAAKLAGQVWSELRRGWGGSDGKRCLRRDVSGSLRGLYRRFCSIDSAGCWTSLWLGTIVGLIAPARSARKTENFSMPQLHEVRFASAYSLSDGGVCYCRVL